MAYLAPSLPSMSDNLPTFDKQGRRPATPLPQLPISRQKSPVHMDDEAKARFLDYYMKHGVITHAAREAGVSRQTVYNHIEKDDEFRAMSEDAYQIYVEAAVIEARRRAIDGNEEELSYQGKKTGDTVRRYSDRLLEKILEAQAPGFSKALKVEHEHSGGVLVVQTDVKDLEAWKKKFAQQLPMVEGEVCEGSDADVLSCDADVVPNEDG